MPVMRYSAPVPGHFTIRKAARALTEAFACLCVLTLPATRAHASFHFAHISEVLTGYSGSSDVQFVEILMDSGGQNLVTGTKLNAFDASGNFIATVLTLDHNVSSGANRPWIMGTPALETAAGIQVDFEFPNGSLPAAGGMICWGRPGNNPTPVTCPLSGFPYVDCLAYGNYSGPTNGCIGAPNPVAPQGHSLRRTQSTDDNAADFVCADPAGPENNARQTASMPATTPCPDGTSTTVPPTSTTILTTTTGIETTTTELPTTTISPATSTTLPTTTTTIPGAQCGDATGDDAINAADALFALRAAVGSVECALSICDVDDNGSVAAADALRILRRAVGQEVTLDCPQA